MTGTVKLNGDRILAFEERGDRGGRPIIHLHGTPGSRLQRFPGESEVAALGIRLITFDRPGYGRSTVMPGRTVLDVADAVCRLADHLGLHRFAVTGMSSGAPYALAVAWALADRVMAAGISCGLGPLDRDGAFEGMTGANVKAFEIARHEPDRLERLLSEGDLAGALPPEEISAFQSIPGLSEMMSEGLAESMHQGWAGVVSDDLALVAPWGFELGDVAVPISVWHGDHDSLIPFHHSEYVAQQVPKATLHRCEGDGHIAMFAHQRAVLEEVASHLN